MDEADIKESKNKHTQNYSVVNSLKEKLRKIWEPFTVGNNLFKQTIRKTFQVST